MWIEDLALLHHNEKSASLQLTSQEPWLEWKTCLRQLYLGLSNWSYETNRAPSEALVGVDAYQRLVEIVCGLHSPLFGETEVFGQFKDLVQAFQMEDAYIHQRFQKLFALVNQDVKTIRNQYLRDCGGISYGSIVRKQVKGRKAVHILGAGQLVREMLPWISKEPLELRIHCRRPEKARDQLAGERFTHLEAMNQSEALVNHGNDALVIAAPMSARDIQEWMVRRTFQPACLIDLRGDCDEDPVELLSGERVDLHKVFEQIAANKQKHQEVRALAIKAIERLTSQRAKEIEYRPYGWEEICNW